MNALRWSGVSGVRSAVVRAIGPPEKEGSLLQPTIGPYPKWRRSHAPHELRHHLAQPGSGVLLQEVAGALEDRVVEALRPGASPAAAPGAMPPVIGSPSLNATRNGRSASWSASATRRGWPRSPGRPATVGTSVGITRGPAVWASVRERRVVRRRARRRRAACTQPACTSRPTSSVSARSRPRVRNRHQTAGIVDVAGRQAGVGGDHAGEPVGVLGRPGGARAGRPSPGRPASRRAGRGTSKARARSHSTCRA